MSLKSHIALGTLLGLLLGAGAVAALSHAAQATESSADAVERDRAAEAEGDVVSPAASVAEDFRRPMLPGARRRLLQS